MTSLGAAHTGEAVVDLDRLAGLFRSRAESRVPVRQRDLPPLERTLRKQVAESLLTHVMPALVSELLEAVADDLTPWRRTRLGRSSRPRLTPSCESSSRSSAARRSWTPSAWRRWLACARPSSRASWRASPISVGRSRPDGSTPTS